MTMIYPHTQVSARPLVQDGPHIAVQILGLLLFAGFAIVSTSLAFVMFWPAGLVLALAIIWFGFRRVLGQGPLSVSQAALGPVVTADPHAVHGNASFAAYRSDVLRRLEDEQVSFEGFLARLRDAKDASEFDNFMDDRARRTRAAVLSQDDGPAGGPDRGAD